MKKIKLIILLFFLILTPILGPNGSAKAAQSFSKDQFVRDDAKNTSDPVDNFFHYFIINSDNHHYAHYTYAFELNKFRCWQMDSSDYLNKDELSSYYLCYDQVDNKEVYKKIKSGADQDPSSYLEINVNNIGRETGSSDKIEYLKHITLGVSFLKIISYAKYWFPKGNYPISGITYHGLKPPTVKISGNSDGRPEIIFQLGNDIQNKASWYVSNNVLIYFINTNTSQPNAKNIVIKILVNNATFLGLIPYKSKLFLANCTTSSYDSCEDLDGYADVQINDDILATFYNHIYNAPGSGSGDTDCGAVTTALTAGPDGSDGKSDKNLANPGWKSGDEPQQKCLNTSDNGWISKWGLSGVDVSATDKSGSNNSDQECGKAGALNISEQIRLAFCGLATNVRDWVNSIMCGAVKQLLNVLTGDPTYTMGPSSGSSTSGDICEKESRTGSTPNKDIPNTFKLNNSP